MDDVWQSDTEILQRKVFVSFNIHKQNLSFRSKQNLEYEKLEGVTEIICNIISDLVLQY